MPKTKTRDFERLHPYNIKTKPLRDKARDLFDGTEAIKAKSKSKKYLYKGRNELDENYEVRLKRATLDPYANKIITARQALIFLKEPTRELPPEIEQHVLDVDNKGTDADVFFENIAENAQVDGIIWVQVDLPHREIIDLELENQRTKLDDENENFRPFFTEIPAGNVLDFQENPNDLQLDWLVLKYYVPERGEPGYERKNKIFYKVWFRNAWEVWKEKESKDRRFSDDKYELIATGPHNLDFVPVIPFYGSKQDNFIGETVLKQVLDYIILLYNKSSDLDWFEYMCSYPIPYSIGPNQPEKLDVNAGFHLYTNENKEQVEVGFLEPKGAGAQSTRESMRDIIYKILSIAMAQARKDTAQVQNADSQREDKRIFAASLKSVSRELEASEIMCWWLWAKWENLKNPDSINVVYYKEFDVKTIDARMLKEFKELVIQNLFPLKDLLQLMIDNGLLERDYDIDAALIAIEQDVMRISSGVDVSHEEEVEDNE